MKAICIESVEGKPELFLRDVPRPEPKEDEVLIRVKCAGVNFADLYRAAKHLGNAGDTPHAIAGLEMTGEVVALGRGVRGMAVGTRVMGFATGAYAEYCCVHDRHLLTVPDALSWAQAASTAGNFVTAHDALVTNGEMKPGEAVLVQAASSGVGIAAVQIARLLGAGLVMGTSTTPAKLERLSQLGLQLGIDSVRGDFAEAVLEATRGAGADVIIENIGGDTLPGDIRCAAVKCRIINVGRLGKWIGEVNLDEHSRKRIRLIGVTFRTRTAEEIAEVIQRAGAVLLPALQAGTIAPVIDRTYPLDAAAEAQEFMRAGRHFGKLVLEVA
ncbi:Beta-ketoacyl-acyl-carrier-protein synthase I [Variovorax sp. PBS-H4]|uniref:zinc-binding dehydrogenase n=1 Tax=Variovorax sp. PBS-H4 TaxID=434008 RepID=UPI00131856F5|nr:zinc-binding dehydrogenase [Variovorax sp. PBS-H4]VTU29884.1 Beta-ketoacyl-acyl-carrier-protein synthase I [Variovorax sp. PBS-H4]